MGSAAILFAKPFSPTRATVSPVENQTLKTCCSLSFPNKPAWFWMCHSSTLRASLLLHGTHYCHGRRNAGHAAAPEVFPACRHWWEMAQAQTFICHRVCCSFLQTILLNSASAAGSALSPIQLCLCFRSMCHSTRLEADRGYLKVVSLS